MPTSKGGIHSVARLCHFLRIPVELSEPHEMYDIGWGPDQEASKKRGRHTWYLTIPDANAKPITLPFDITYSNDPLIVGMEVKKFAHTLNRHNQRRMVFQMPSDTSERTMYTYIAKDRYGNDRLWLDIVPNKQSTSRSLMSNISKRPAYNFAKKIHRYTHATAHEMKHILKDAGIIDPSVDNAFDRITDSWDICKILEGPHRA